MTEPKEFTLPFPTQTHAHEIALKQRDAMDELIEVMLANPDGPGISVRTKIRHDYANNAYAADTTTQLDPDVPFGEIRYHDIEFEDDTRPQ